MNVHTNHVVVIGAGGHAKVVIDLIQLMGVHVIAGVLDDDLEGKVAGYAILGPVERLAEFTGTLAGGIVAIGDNVTRHRVVDRIMGSVPEFKFLSAVHPSAVVARGVTIGEGSVLMAGVVVNCGSVIGRHCIINTRASVDHDNVISDFSSLAPGVTTGGSVRIGERAAIGLGAAVSHRISVGADTVVGAGATVLTDLPPGIVAYGTPAKMIRPRAYDEKYL